MIVCSCNVLTDHDVRSTLKTEQTPRTAGQVYGCLGCSAQCGRCARTIRRIMDEALAVASDVAVGCGEACKCCPRGQHNG
jgi:bacterioferritin-associated ferredoxin